MVEMHYPLDDDREAFNRFYHKHITMLLSIDGFLSAQRYECTHEARSPFLAVYRLKDPDVMTSEGYTSRAGRDSVDPVFKAKMTNWDRNLVQGDIENMDVADNGWMVLIDRLSADSALLPEGFYVALDRRPGCDHCRTGCDDWPRRLPARHFRCGKLDRSPIPPGSCAAAPGLKKGQRLETSYRLERRENHLR